MPSPFPGMDPYLEGQLWPDFHNSMIAGLRAALVPLLRPRYVAVVEERIYLEHPAEESSGSIRPDVTVARGAEGPKIAGSRRLGLLAPVQVPLPMPERARERFLEIRHHEGREVVAVVELPSPSNKRPHGDGRREYLAKREALLQSAVHLVELDLLRGGDRLPMAAPLPPADYYVLVSRAPRRPMAEVWPVRLEDPLPVVPIPLAADDPDVEVDLQAVFESVYDSSGYDYSVDRSRPVRPALPDWAATLAW